jgi:hypothetical protein
MIGRRSALIRENFLTAAIAVPLVPDGLAPAGVIGL